MSQQNALASRPDSPRGAAGSSGELEPAGGPQKGTSGALGECKECCLKQAEIERLKGELEEWQQRCRLAEEQSQRARDELQSLEGEMEELHDNFKEEENEQFEQVKQELDACLKNCKILQIRLNKSERQYNQLEQVKQMLERQLQERLAPAENKGGRDENDCDNDASAGEWKRRQRTSELAGGQAGSQTETQAGGEDFVKVPTSEYDQMLRDLNDTSERERDLQEQIKYSQEEAQLKGERLQAIEAENEILLGRINKLTLANSNLRSSTMLAAGQQEPPHQEAGNVANLASASERDSRQKLRELCEQNEQLKLALELAQSEAERLRSRIQECSRTLEAREQALQEAEAKARRLAELEKDRDQQQQASRPGSRMELECRQLRARLVHSERECRQLRSQMECLGQGNTTRAGFSFRSHSLDSPTQPEHRQQTNCTSGKCQEVVRQLERQCKSLLDRNNQLELKLQKLAEMSSESFEQRTNLESELIEKLKLQLDSSESELAKAKSRLVELDIECGRAQRQYKRLMVSLETCGSAGGEFQLLRRNKLPSESARDSLSRQELRQAIRDLELDVDDLLTMVKAKECFIREQAMAARQQSGSSPESSASPTSTATPASKGGEQAKSHQTSEQQVKSLRRLLDQQQLLSNNLKLDVTNLEQENQELKTHRQVLERERVAMDEELDKLRQVLGELRAELEESEGEKEKAQARSHQLGETLERLKLELEQARAGGQRHSPTGQPAKRAQGLQLASESDLSSRQNLLVMARDLSELKVKNGFLMRQLEMAGEDAARQLDEVRSSCLAQQKRAVELAQLELRERHLQEGQQARDELNDLRQKLAQLTRQAARQEEETNLERDRARALERDWRRDKSQWQQAREQLEGQLAIEKRSSEFRLKEAEAAIRDKERSLMSVQDRCVQLERDLKRLQNKFHLLEESNDSKIKQLTRDLEMRTKDLNELTRQKQRQEEQQYETMKRLNDDKSTLKETLETIKRSYDEKLAEARQLRELLQSRQEQAYRERTQLVERVEGLNKRLNEMAEQETQAKLLRQRLEIQERQLESTRRELISAKEERTKLRDRCDELERHELITKTSSISGLSPAHHSNPTSSSSSSSFLRPFGSKAQLVGRALATGAPTQRAGNEHAQPGAQLSSESQQLQLVVEKLSGKINDQRNLINILRQQWAETQMELKQARLLQASERSKWQANVALLTGRLNECEEKLAYETLLLQGSPAMIDQLARPKLESSWSLERQASSELIKQQQGQIELLTRDLKKISQAHELLRLQSKQLEAHNNKLSKKLIEFQQQSSFASQQDRQLESNYERILERHSRLSREMRPLVEVVSKMVNSLDAPEQVAAGTKGGRGDSTERPLRAGVSPVSRFDSDESDAAEPLSSVIQTSRPAHQLNKTVQQTRLTRLLAGGKVSARETSSSPARSPGASGLPPDITLAGAPNAKPASKTTRRVRVKCSTLGITTSEKKQLKQQLKRLAEMLALDEEGDTGALAAAKTRQASPGRPLVGSRPESQMSGPKSSPLHSNTNQLDKDRLPRATGASPEETDQSSQRSQASRVRWQLDSDLESERSWSLEPSSEGGRTADIYRRFPQATPSSGRHSFNSAVGASLTDYESESSMAASDCSLSGGYPSVKFRPGPSGAESDSGIGAAKISRKKSTGFKGRLTSTLRNISRSITGLGSDTEDPTGAPQSQARSAGRPSGGEIRATETTARDRDRKSPSILKEIRV